MAEIEPRMIEDLLRIVLGNAIRCFPEGDFLVLDTPYILQDGHFLRAYLEVSKDGYQASDGGFIQRQLETYSRSGAMLRERTNDVREIAQELSLGWDGELSYQDESLEGLIRRLSVLARGADRALSALSSRSIRKPMDVRTRLREQLIQSGFIVRLRARPEVPNGMKPVIVDQLVRQNGRQAAVEVLTARTDSGASIAVDRAIANFHVLERFNYQGSLFAVYDHDSPAGGSHLLERLNAGKPDSAIVIPDNLAAKVIQEKLAS